MVAFYEVLISLTQSFKKIDRRESVKLPIRSAIALLTSKYEIGDAVYRFSARTEVEFVGKEVIYIGQFAGKRHQDLLVEMAEHD